MSKINNPNSFHIVEFRNIIERCISDTAEPEISIGLILTAGHGDIPKIRETLLDWQEKGYLKIINDPAECTDRKAVCVLMLSSIDESKFRADFVKWKNP